MSDNATILVGDIGGTNTRLALADIRGKTIEIAHFEKFKGDDFSCFEDIITAYLSHLDCRPKAAALAVAGPIHGGEVSFTNRDWRFSETALSKQFSFTKTRLYNDFAAMSRSVLLMNEDSFLDIYDSGKTDEEAPIIVAGPGTGFGMGIVLPSCNPPHVLPTEGGHQAYAPLTQEECDILQILRDSHEFVSLELVTSGSGMNAVHQALCKLYGQDYKRLPPQIIRERADAGDQICLDVCEIRAAAVMGAVADMALATGALGGVVLAGGVSERLVDFLRAPKAMARFFERGQRTAYMKRISIRLLHNDEAPLYGAAGLYKDALKG